MYNLRHLNMSINLKLILILCVLPNIFASIEYGYVAKTASGKPCLNTCKNGQCYIDYELKKDLRKNNRNLSYEDFIDLYDSNKKLEIKYNNDLIDIDILFDKFKQEQYAY
ncbi:N1R/p28-like protein [Choristoneura rosaceana entomopoxvirus 'L']|uniref:N1R/p28-like protein n=1 Tax=Choristoneura rosaceana entomopoxvirus 'L' TaxID=1293539 RepID=A0ABM9QKX3_9POXV|nr:N1R/p28-like protein [Choristoneura rosaceana entomopoxvirus 'L']CCU56179.1 N1R/p28-like protein [Choristoneura rosaceana entomopoxvirus 'L']